jgi:transcriptional regulator GlxA family with amidase domain
MRKMGLVLYPDFQILCFAVISAFEVANKRAGEKIYDLHVLSERGGLLRSSLDIQISTETMAEDDYDTILVDCNA